MHAHHIKKCTVCGGIIEQCRCMDANKPVEAGICKGCSRKIEDEARTDGDGKKHGRHNKI